MNKITQLCNSCTCSGNITINNNTKTKCNNTKLSAYEVFTSSKHDILESNVNNTFKTYKRSFINYIVTFRECEIESKQLINNILTGMYDIHDSFSDVFYKRVDLYISKWDSWFSRFSLYLKHLMVNGYICDNVEDVIVSSILDYDFIDHKLNIRVSDMLHEYIIKYIKNLNIEIPKENGDYSHLLKLVHGLLLTIYEIAILQFIQEDRLYESKSGLLYYHTKYKTLSNDFEKELLEFRVEYIVEKFNTFKLVIGDNTPVTKKVIESTILINYRDSITNWNDLK